MPDARRPVPARADPDVAPPTGARRAYLSLLNVSATSFGSLSARQDHFGA